jgi:NAD(P)-dependent dehydrogenase (short-subunit alcohol dehydrogenase family)
MVLDAFRLDGRLAVITGGAGLLGPRHAEALLEAGAQVVLLDVQAAKLSEIKSMLSDKFPGRVHALVVDLTKEAEILNAKTEIFAKFKKYPEILINNAAIDAKFDASSSKKLSRLENFPLEQWNLEISVGLTAAMLMAKTFGIEMAAAGRGVILNISSDLGVIAPDQRLYKKDGVTDDQQNVKPITYSAIKHGLIGLTKYLATYWGDRNVRCNAFAPGGVFNDHPREFTDKLTRLIPMGRMARLDEYQASILFMVSDASSYMNGATLNMDGGRTAW